MLFPIHDDNPTVRFPFVTCGLVIANVLAFLWLLTLPAPQQEEVVIHRGFVPARIEQLSRPNQVVELKLPQIVRVPVVNQQIQVIKTFRLPADPPEIYASLFWTMFLHGGWMHLIFNMWFLWLFGNNVEDRLGHFIYLCFYLLGGLLATACHWAYDPHSTTPVIGASGAVSAVLGAYIVTWPTAKIRTLIFLVLFITIVELPAVVVLGFWFVTQIVEALGLLPMLMRGGAKVAEPSSVAWWAHVGGFAAGVLLMPLLSAGAPPTGTDWKKEADKLFELPR